MLGLAYLNTQSRKTQQEEETKQVASLSEAVVAKSEAQARITAETQAQAQTQELTGLSSFSQTPERSGDIELAAFTPSSTGSSSLSTTSSATASSSPEGGFVF